MMAGSVLSASDKLMTAAATGNTDLVLQLLANNSSSTLEPDEVMQHLIIQHVSLEFQKNWSIKQQVRIYYRSGTGVRSGT